MEVSDWVFAAVALGFSLLVGGIGDLVGVDRRLRAIGLVNRLLGRRQAQEQEREPTLTDRIEQLRENLSESGALIGEINAELQVQTAALERMRAEADENQRLAALHKNEAEAVRQLVATTIEFSHGKSLRQQKRAQWLFFLAGLLFSIPLGVGVNFLYDVIVK